jgi:hypothetical protein
MLFESRCDAPHADSPSRALETAARLVARPVPVLGALALDCLDPLQNTTVHPAMEWLLQCLCYRACHDDLLPLWEYCKMPERRAMLLIPLLTALSSQYLVDNAMEIAQIVSALH